MGATFQLESGLQEFDQLGSVLSPQYIQGEAGVIGEFWQA
jgi:hypothetical protein